MCPPYCALRTRLVGPEKARLEELAVDVVLRKQVRGSQVHRAVDLDTDPPHAALLPAAVVPCAPGAWGVGGAIGVGSGETKENEMMQVRISSNQLRIRGAGDGREGGSLPWKRVVRGRWDSVAETATTDGLPVLPF